MKFLAEVNVEKSIVEEITTLGYDIKCVTSINPLMTDEDVLSTANSEDRILITNDKDFGEIVFRQQLIASGIILIRVVDQNTQDKVKLVKKLLIFYKDKIKNHFVVISNNKFRSIPLNQSPCKEV